MYRLDLHVRIFAQTHDGAGAEVAFYLSYGGVYRLLFFFLVIADGNDRCELFCLLHLSCAFHAFF